MLLEPLGLSINPVHIHGVGHAILTIDPKPNLFSKKDNNKRFRKVVWSISSSSIKQSINIRIHVSVVVFPSKDFVSAVLAVTPQTGVPFRQQPEFLAEEQLVA
jgi:hypothetical protein